MGLHGMPNSDTHFLDDSVAVQDPSPLHLTVQPVQCLDAVAFDTVAGILSVCHTPDDADVRSLDNVEGLGLGSGK
jgi:hypothetical protein